MLIGRNTIFRCLYILFTSLCLHLAVNAQVTAQQKKIDSLQKCLLLAIPDTTKINILLQLAGKMDCKDSLQRLRYAEQAIALSEKIKWSRGLFHSYLNIGDIYQYCFKNNEQAINEYKKMEEIAMRRNDKESESFAYNELGLIYQNTGQYSLALDYFNKIILINVNSDNAMGSWANMGVIYNNIGNYPKALECYERSLKILNEKIISDKKENMDYLYMQAGLLTTIAELYLAIHEYDNALINYETELDISKKISTKYLENTKYLECYAYKGIGQCFILKKDFENGILNYKKALHFAKETNSIGNVDVVKGYEEAILDEISNAYLQKGDDKQALSYAQQSLMVANQNKNKPQLAKTFITLGKIYSYQKDNKNALRYLRQAITIANETGAKDEEKDAWEALSNVYKQTKQFDKAYAALNNFYALRDSIYNIDKAKELTRIDMQGKIDRTKDSTNAEKKIAATIAANKLQRQRVLTYGGFAGVAVFLLLAFLMFRNYTNEKKANTIITKANKIIREEKQVSENLLLNILPAHVAEELKANGDVQARQFDDVTVLFTDFVNFTTAGELMTASELVAELNACFTNFDEIISKYNIEKIKTVGDAYLAVAGLPQVNVNHAVDMVNAAIEIRDFMVARKQQLGDRSFSIRLGINSGDVVAGIVGVKKFAYDIWGDTVNIAARMEQNSEAGKINLSQSTYELVKDQFICTYRGEVEAKNKGLLKMYYVNR